MNDLTLDRVLSRVAFANVPDAARLITRQSGNTVSTEGGVPRQRGSLLIDKDTVNILFSLGVLDDFRCRFCSAIGMKDEGLPLDIHHKFTDESLKLLERNPTEADCDVLEEVLDNQPISSFEGIPSRAQECRDRIDTCRRELSRVRQELFGSS